ncbi:hypothetical protein DAPPUDRAFT_265194 [Daphnia pulex]|uniref:Uncharacterized protein n=1 Tax=Daphnia pulex TaxID=6669 RepID=E9HT13_DAPPU|nr:hypothetical protein DAPPUDRAFT_265194 [Daphnia pulex]|eukprot:EFX65123.1 hypothetical protein DAPPUDRAFT_265194 [Daphnia pulex]
MTVETQDTTFNPFSSLRVKPLASQEDAPYVYVARQIVLPGAFHDGSDPGYQI